MTILFAGLALGAVYSIVAYGYNLTSTMSGVLNFATAHMTMLGSFVAAWVLTDRGLSPWLALLICAAVGWCIGLVVELVAVAPLRSYRLNRSRGDGHGELVTTVGASTMITGIAFLLWGAEARVVPLFADNSRISLLGGHVRKSDLAVILAALIIGVSLQWWMSRTRSGLAGLAFAEDREAAMLQGVNVRQLSSQGFAIAGAIGCSMGLIVGSKTFAAVGLVMLLAIKGFVAVVIGGLGSQIGALTGGALLGVIEICTARWIGADFALLVLFLVFVAFVSIRPQGLFGRKEGRTV